MSFIDRFKQIFNINQTTTSEKEQTTTVVTDDYTKLKVVELRKLAKERGFKGYSGLKKAQLIELLNKQIKYICNKTQRQQKLSPFYFCISNYYVTFFNKKILARTYAAKFMAKNDPLWAAEEIFSIMEESIQYDDAIGQDLTKEFLVDIIEIMNSIDKEYTSEVTKEYVLMAVELAKAELK